MTEQINSISLSLASTDSSTHYDLARFMSMEKPGDESIVLAIETLTSSARRYVHVVSSGDIDQYEEVMNFYYSYYDPKGRHVPKNSRGEPVIPTFPYALHEVVRAGLNRRAMFDVDFKEGVSKDTLLRSIELLRSACRTAYESYGNPWEIDLSDEAFRVMLSDERAPFKGFHLLLTSVMMPAASVARLYCAIREILVATPEGRIVSEALDDKPTTETFNMRLYGSPKINRPDGRKKATTSRQKRLLDCENSVVYDPYVDLREYLIQPGPQRNEKDQLVYHRTLHPDDEKGRRTVTSSVEGSANERLASCELLNGWEVRGEVKTGEYNGKPWWRQDLTLIGGERRVCSVCDRVHANRTDYLWLTGEGLVDEAKPIYVRCRSRAQTAAEKEANNYKYNVVATIQAPTKRAEPLALKYAFSFEGYTGKPLKTPLTAFLDSQKSAHLVAIEAADRSAATKRAEKVQLNADLATAVAHQQNVMQKAIEAEKNDCSAIHAALDELEAKGADYAIHGQRDFNTLNKRVYKNEYELICAIHCNAWIHDQEGAAIWNEGRWEPKNWNDPAVTTIRNQMRFRTESGTEYGGKDFWREITKAYIRSSQTCFTPHPLGRSAIGLPSPSVWRMYRGINSYCGLRASPMPRVNESALAQHRDAFEHFLRAQIAGEGDEYYRYLMGWLASSMQRPHEKIGIALLIRGPMGCGKSLFLSLLKAIVPHATVVTNKGLTTLTDKFNTDLDNRTLYMFGEVPEARRISNDQLAAIKTVITDDVLHIEYKNKTIVQKKQYLNLIVCSNMLNCIETSEGDRRWCVLDTSFPVHDKDDLEYWERTYPLFNSPEFQASIQQLLLDYDIQASGFVPKEYPKSEALQVTRNELPIVNYALKYPNLRQRVTTYLQDKPDYELNRPATLRDIVICHRLDEGSESSRADTVEQQEKDLYYAMCNVPQVKERFSFHPDNDGGRMTRINAAGRSEVLKHAIVWGADEEESHRDASTPLSCSAAVRDRDAAMAEMITMMKAAGLDVSKFVQQFPALGEGPERFDRMGQSALRAALKERGIAYSGRDSVAILRAKLRG